MHTNHIGNYLNKANELSTIPEVNCALKSNRRLIKFLFDMLWTTMTKAVVESCKDKINYATAIELANLLHRVNA